MQDFTDSVYIIEGNDNIQPTSFINFGFYLEILGTRHTKKGTEYHIKWEEYAETTWYVYLNLLNAYNCYTCLCIREPLKNIPRSIREYYDETGDGKLPTPRVKESIKQGPF